MKLQTHLSKVIATPDPTHAMIAMAALKAGKHVYVQNPLTHLATQAASRGN